MNRTAAFSVLIIFSLLITISWLWACHFSVTGSWSVTIDSLDLQAGAGSDLISTYESATNQIDLDIEESCPWRVDVRKSDTNWHNNFTLYVRRTSEGNGPGILTGGTTYQAVTDSDQTFFTGDDEIFNVYVQLKLDNVSLQIPPDSYTTTVTYTMILL